MAEREIRQKVEIDNRTFIIEKMDALESIAVLKEILTKTLPLDLLSTFGDSVSSLVGRIDSPKKDMSIDEFIRLQKRILKYVFESLPSGMIPIIDSNNNYAVDDFEKNLDLAVSLLFKSVRFNYESFFLEKLQKMGLLEKIQETFEATLPTK